VQLSSFRALEQLPGTAHPVVYAVRFACACGDEHQGLVAHDELDYAPLGLGEGAFLNLMTAHMDDVAAELGELAARRIQAGEWPWSFYCYPEERPRPVYPSSFFLLSAGRDDVGVVEHVFADDATRAVEEFRSELYSARFDARRLDLQ
jgi:hypothetical protein